MERAIIESGDQPAIAIRTAYIDIKMAAALNEGIYQIVILAAGMDARAYRMSFPSGTKVFELDRQVCPMCLAVFLLRPASHRLKSRCDEG